MRPVIIFRSDTRDEQEEKLAAKEAGLIVLDNFGQIQCNDLVIARYCSNPFYSWVAEGIEELGGRLINSAHQNSYVIDLINYAYDLRELTPQVFTWENFSSAPEGKYIVKGQTNSRKFLWKDNMFAENISQAWEIARNLQRDGLLENQKIYFRPYLKLKEFFPSRYNHPPITDEYRFFVLNGTILGGSYYWSSVMDELEGFDLSPNKVPTNFLQEVISRIGEKISFYSLDVAQTEDGKWVVIELNEGQMSGLSSMDPKFFYSQIISSLRFQGKI